MVWDPKMAMCPNVHQNKNAAGSCTSSVMLCLLLLHSEEGGLGEVGYFTNPGVLVWKEVTPPINEVTHISARDRLEKRKHSFLHSNIGITKRLY